MVQKKGETWNESEVYQDSWTLRQVRRVTKTGLYNQTPTYHTNVGFTADGEFLIFASARAGKSAVYRCHVPTGDITCLIEPVDGVDGYGAVERSDAALGNGRGITGHGLCLAPRTRWAAFSHGRTIRAVHIESLEERTLIPDVGSEWLPGIASIDPQEEFVIVPLVAAYHGEIAGLGPGASYRKHFAEGGMRTRLLHVGLMGGEVTTVYEDDGPGCAHCPHCPTEADLLIIDRDFPPEFWCGSDGGATTRVWTLRLSTGELTELRPRDEQRFQVHAAWTWDGQNVLYHGWTGKGGYYIGVIDREGSIVREYHFPEANHYGHVSAMAGRPAIILDGNISPDMLLWLYYDHEKPRLEIIARHGTQWNALPGQYPHPHPLCDPAGRWISFNAAHHGRSDVFIVEV